MSEGSGLTPEEHWLRYGRYPYLLAKLCAFAAIAGALTYAVISVQDVLFPVATSLLLAYLLDPAIDRFEARGYSRTGAIALFLVFGAGAVGAFLLFLYPTIAHLISQVGEVFPRLADLVQHDLVPRLRAIAPDRVPADLESLLAQYGDTARQALPSLANGVRTALTNAWDRTGAIASSVMNLVLVPILTFYFLRDFDVMRLAAVEYLPLHNRTWTLQRIARMDEVVGFWIRGQFEVAGILAVLYAAGLGLTMGLSGVGVSSGIAVGLLSGFLNVVPYFGFLVGILLSTLLVVLDWHGWLPLVGVGATFAIVQALEGYVVTPRIVGEKVGLSPLVVIVSLLLGSQLLGVLGVVVALPLAGIVRVLLPDLVDWYRESDLYTGQLRRTSVPAREPLGPAVVTTEAPALAGGERVHVLDAGGVRREAPRGGDPLQPGGPGLVGAPGEPVPPAGEPRDGGERVPDGASAGPLPGGPPSPDQRGDDGGDPGAAPRSDG
jgi:predicted PurR-regulated permease PerM